MNESAAVLCQCGCGQPAPIAKKTIASKGYVKGRPVRFIRGHVGRTQRKDPVECSVEECDRQAKARGLCEGHRRRVAKTGKTGGALGPTPPIERVLPSVCGDRHRWEPDERHAQEGYRCGGCGITEAELDREQYGRAYVDGDDWNADEELY